MWQGVKDIPMILHVHDLDNFAFANEQSACNSNSQMFKF